MRSGGGKAKGSQFERDACVLLSQWISNKAQEDIFWRAAMSGGRATVAHKKSGKLLSSQVGDISCVHPAGSRFISAFAVECKFYAVLNYEGLLTGKGKILQFWNEIKSQAKTHHKHPFMLARQNRMQTMVCLDINGRKELEVPYKDMLLVSVRHNIHIIEAERFFRVVKPYVDVRG